MTRVFLFIWALSVPLSAAPVHTRSLDLMNISDDKSTSTSLIEEVLDIAGSDNSAIKVAILFAFIAVLSVILLACLMVGFFVNTTKKIRELAKLLDRDNSISKDLESGLREEMKADEETVISLSPTDWKPDKNYHKQRELMLMSLKKRQIEHPLALTKMTSMEKVSQRKRKRRSRNERNKGTTLKVQSSPF